MKAVRASLLLFMSLIVLMMTGFPAFYDSKRQAVSSRHHRDAPSAATLKELQDARRLDRRDILIFEFAMAGLVALAAFGLAQTRKYDSTRAN
jgi:hypothetical protein